MDPNRTDVETRISVFKIGVFKEVVRVEVLYKKRLNSRSSEDIIYCIFKPTYLPNYLPNY